MSNNAHDTKSINTASQLPYRTINNIQNINQDNDMLPMCLKGNKKARLFNIRPKV